jgi:hypothetical protein
VSIELVILNHAFSLAPSAAFMGSPKSGDCVICSHKGMIAVYGVGYNLGGQVVIARIATVDIFAFYSRLDGFSKPAPSFL